MPRRRSDGGSKSAGVGRVKAASRGSGSAYALALTRPEPADTLTPIRSPLTSKTVASPACTGLARALGSAMVAASALAMIGPTPGIVSRLWRTFGAAMQKRGTQPFRCRSGPDDNALKRREHHP